MRELKIGERITIEPVEVDSEECTGCVFNDIYCHKPCRDIEDKLEKLIIFKQVQVHTFTDEELENLKADVRKETLNQVKLLVHWPNVKDAIAEFESLMEETK